ncbi:MAG: polysulfide reductase NrfD [Actinobacteria bacterium]|nr:polysulfide reductase NrfD [Actinomycetota bacterium]
MSSDISTASSRSNQLKGWLGGVIDPQGLIDEPRFGDRAINLDEGPKSSTVRSWVKILDQTRCIGCHACTTACKSENNVPLGVNRTYVKSVDVGVFPQVRRAFQVTRCNQCENPPCVAACPTGAMYRRPDGIVDFDKRICIACKACMAACPYDAIFINPEDHSAEKCNFCAHRLEIGLEPACVVVCPTEAIRIGDLADASSPVSADINRKPVTVRRPEKETRPKVFYLGAHMATLDPLAAERPPGGLYAWAGQGSGPGHVASGHPGKHNSRPAAVLSYDVPHHAPWDWKVSLYTWTKGIGAGAYLVPLLLVLFGPLAWTSTLFRWVGPLVALGGLGATGALLIWDLGHPERFYLIFLRHQWRSWLVRGSFIIGAYGTVLVLQVLASILKSVAFSEVLAGFGLPLAAMTAVYTAFLFAQAKARDLWQSPLLPGQLIVQALLLGSAASLFAAQALGAHGVVHDLRVALGAIAVLDLSLVIGEMTLDHVTAHTRLASHEIWLGKFRFWFWAGMILLAATIATPWIGATGAGFALASVLCYEHSYVQGGQSVPLA